MTTHSAWQENTTALILAGGLGTRLRSVVGTQPKVIAEVNERPFLTYILDLLSKTGIRKVILCVGYQAEQVVQTIGPSYDDMAIEYSKETEPLGTGGALRNSMSLIKTPYCLILNGDSYCSFDYTDLFNFHIQNQSTATIALVEVEDASRYGLIKLGPDNQIIGFQEKQPNAGPGLINSGIYLVNSKSILAIPENRKCSLEQEVFPSWIGKSFFGYPCQAKIFIDIGLPSSFAEAQNIFSQLNKDK